MPPKTLKRSLKETRSFKYKRNKSDVDNTLGVTPSLLMPFIMTVVGATGSGKTYNFISLIDNLQKGNIGLKMRFTSVHGNEGEPAKFDRIYYFGMRSDDSMDEKHNSQIRTLIGCAAKHPQSIRDKRAWSFNEYRHHFYCSKGLGNVANLDDLDDLIPIPDSELLNSFLREFKSQVYGNKWSWNLIVLDDFLSLVENLKGNTKKIIENFQIGSHHEGTSFAFLCQENPKQKVGQAIVKSSHYFMFPMYKGISNVDDLHTFFQRTDGKSATRVEEIREQIMNPKTKPNYLIYNRKSLLSDYDLLK